MADISISEQDHRTFIRLQDLAAKYDGPDGLRKKMEKLEADNADYREKNKALEAKAAAVPEGAVVLTAEEAAKWAKVKDVDVDDLTAKAAAGEEAATKLAGYEWERAARKVAADNGMNADALVVLPGIRGFAFEAREVTEGDKKVTRWTAKDAEGKTAEVGKDWITGREEWKPLATAVFAAAESGTGKTNGGGFTFTPERPAGGSTVKTSKDHVDAVRTAVDYTV
jgi:hypothetical protein